MTYLDKKALIAHQATQKARKEIQMRQKLLGMSINQDSFIGRIQNRSYIGKPTTKYKGIRKTNLTSELLGAGSDPLCKD